MNKLLALGLPGGESFSEDLSGNQYYTGSIDSTLVKNPASIINAIIPLLFVLGGLALFSMLIGGGFTIFTSAGNPEKTKKGTAMITNGFIGLVIMLAAYWIVQLIEFSLGLKLL